MKLASLTLIVPLACASLPPVVYGREITARFQKVVAGKEAVVGRHSQWDRNCRSLEIPTIKIDTPPKHGKLQAGPSEYKPTRAVSGARYTNCLGKEMAGTALMYLADPHYSGPDELSYTVFFSKMRSGARKYYSYKVALIVARNEQEKATQSHPVVKAGPPKGIDATTIATKSDKIETAKTNDNNRPSPVVAAPQASAAAPSDKSKSDQAKELAKNQEQLKADQQGLKNQQTATAGQVEEVERLLGGVVLPAWSSSSEWMMRVAAVPVQQQQFCRIVDRFYSDLADVYKVHNDIKQNALFRERKLDLATLLPGGQFENWVVQIKEVTQAADGSAAVMLQPPCRAMLGSDACQKDTSKIRATIAPGSPLYRELARVNAGDFVIVSGKVLYAEAANADQTLPAYAVFRPGEHCSSAEGARQEDVFVTEIHYLVQLR